MEVDYPFISLGGPFRWLALALLVAFAGAAVACLLFLASLPGRIATKRHHPQASAVNVCGWLGLPTGVLWVLALAWAYQNRDVGDNGQLDRDLSRVEGLVAQLEAGRQSTR